MGIIQRTKTYIKSKFEMPKFSRPSISNAKANIKKLARFGGAASTAAAFFPIGRTAKVGYTAGKLGVKAIPSLITKARQSVGMLPKQSWGKFAKGTGELLGGSALGYYAITGKLPEPSLRTAAAFVGGKLSIPGLATGLIHGGGEKLTDFTKEKIQDFRDFRTTPENSYLNSDMYKKTLEAMYGNGKVPDIVPDIKFDFPKIDINLPPQNFPEFTLPQSIGSPSYTAPGVSVSSPSMGLGDVLPLLALLGVGAGVGGYALGRRRRKRKKKRGKRKKKKWAKIINPPNLEIKIIQIGNNGRS